MRKILIGLIILLAVLAQIKAENNPVFVKRSGVTQIVLFDGKTTKTIFQTGKKAVYDIKVSPKNKYISALEVTEGIIEGHGYKVLPKNRLVIISQNGEIVNVIDEDIQRYDWSPSGDKLSCITGSYYEGGIGFRPKGIFIYNLITKEKRSIQGIPIPYKVYWGTTGNIVYIKDLFGENGKRVYRYTVNNHQLELTEYHDIYFAPNGDYYIREPDMEYDFAVFETQTNQPIQLPENLGKPIRWVFDNGNYLLFKNKDETIEYNKIPKSKPGAIVPPVWPKKRTLNSVTYSIYDVKKGVVVKEETTDMISDWIVDKFSFPIQSKSKAPGRLTLE